MREARIWLQSCYGSVYKSDLPAIRQYTFRNGQPQNADRLRADRDPAKQAHTIVNSLVSADRNLHTQEQKQTSRKFDFERKAGIIHRD